MYEISPTVARIFLLYYPGWVREVPNDRSYFDGAYDIFQRMTDHVLPTDMFYKLLRDMEKEPHTEGDLFDRGLMLAGRINEKFQELIP